MPQAHFFYQQKVDPGWYLVPPVAPDLSWMQTTAVRVAPVRPVIRSVQVDATWLASVFFQASVLAPPLALPSKPLAFPTPQRTSTVGFLAPPIDLSWLQTCGVFLPPPRGKGSASASSSWFLAPPLDVSWRGSSPALAPSLSSIGSQGVDPTLWMAPSPALFMQAPSLLHPRLASPLSVMANPVEVIASSTPPDLSWLQTHGVIGARHGSLASTQASPATFLSLAPAPDLSWMPTQNVPCKRQSAVVSAAASPTHFLANTTPGDVSWLQTGSTLPIRAAEGQSQAGSIFVSADLFDLPWLSQGAAFAPQALAQHSQWVMPFALSPPLDLSWLQTHRTAVTTRRGLPSIQADASGFLAIPPPPDLSWLQTHGLLLLPRAILLSSTSWNDPASIPTGGALIAAFDSGPLLEAVFTSGPALEAIFEEMPRD